MRSPVLSAALVATMLLSGCLSFGSQPPLDNSTTGGEGAPQDAGPRASEELKTALAEAQAGHDELAAAYDELETIRDAADYDTSSKLEAAMTKWQAMLRLHEAQEERLRRLKELDRDNVLHRERPTLKRAFNQIPGSVSDPKLVAGIDAMAAPASTARKDIAVRSKNPDLFLVAHPDRFRFVNRATGGLREQYHPTYGSRRLAKGEPVLVFRSGKVLTVDGQVKRAADADLSPIPLAGSIPHPLKPSWLTVKKDGKTISSYLLLHGGDKTGFELSKGDFLAATTKTTPGLQPFLEARERVIACYQKQMKRLDPSGTRKKYVRKTGTKVEPLAKVHDRTACSACGCARFNDRKRAFVRELAAPLLDEAHAAVEPRIERINGLFSAK